MGLLEDVMKALERIPAWKRINELPAEMSALQKRVAALEAKLGPKTGEECPKCGDRALHLISSAPSATFGFAGVKVDQMKCSACGFEESRQRRPPKS